jgi:hypothetical protein
MMKQQHQPHFCVIPQEIESSIGRVINALKGVMAEEGICPPLMINFLSIYSDKNFTL